MFGSLNTYTSVLEPAKETMSVSILGTGEFGRSLASRLAEAGAEVRLGTRDINNVRCEVGPGVDIVTNKVAMREGRVVILAIPGQFQKSLAGMSELRPGTVVVDCSNRFSRLKDGKLTHAEEIARIFPPNVSIVKALNTLSLSDLTGDTNVVREVPVASDNPSARILVSTLITLLGHRPLDLGDLRNSRRMENMPLVLFPGYRRPLLASVSVWVMVQIMSWLRTVLCHHGNTVWTFSHLLSSLFTVVNNSCSSHALIMMAVAQLGPVVLDYLYLIRGTKYTLTPRWLNSWTSSLRLRLYPLILVSLTTHAWLATFLPTTTRSCLPAGVPAYLALLLLTLSLHPVISSLMSSHEKVLTCSVLSWTSLLLGTAHTLMSDWDNLTSFQCLPSPHQISLILPSITIFLQVLFLISQFSINSAFGQAPLMLPWIRQKLVQLRRGHVYRGIYERKI